MRTRLTQARPSRKSWSAKKFWIPRFLVSFEVIFLVRQALEAFYFILPLAFMVDENKLTINCTISIPNGKFHFNQSAVCEAQILIDLMGLGSLP